MMRMLALYRTRLFELKNSNYTADTAIYFGLSTFTFLLHPHKNIWTSVVVVVSSAACQCNGHSTCVNGSVCEQCRNLTTGPNCQTCMPGYHGDPTNGGKCQGECPGEKTAQQDFIDTLLFKSLGSLRNVLICERKAFFFNVLFNINQNNISLDIVNVVNDYSSWKWLLFNGISTWVYRGPFQATITPVF